MGLVTRAEAWDFTGVFVSDHRAPLYKFPKFNNLDFIIVNTIQFIAEDLGIHKLGKI